MHQYINAKIPTDNDINKGFRSYLIGFIFERFLFIIIKLLIIVAVYGLLYLCLGITGQETSIIKNSFWAVSLIYLLLAILRLKMLWPINLFTSINFNSGFQEAATSHIDSYVDDTPVSLSMFNDRKFDARDNDYATEKFLFKIIKAPGDAVGDLIVLIVQIIYALFFAKKYIPYLNLLAKQNGNAITGNEILEYILQNNYKINEISCKEVLQKMISFEWVIAGQMGYRLTSKMRRNLDKYFKD